MNIPLENLYTLLAGERPDNHSGEKGCEVT
jgi:hypothetical protein